MSPLEILLDEKEMADLTDLTADRLDEVIAACPTAEHAMVAAFTLFVASNQMSGLDAATQFEAMLAFYEKRVRATHRGSGAMN